VGKRRYPEQTGIIPEMLGRGEYTPRAAMLQKQTGGPDQELLALARRNLPNVMWWWGIRKVQGVMSAYCYVCSEVICRGALSTGITSAQTDAIDLHRASHWEQVRQARTSQTN
jgi:hypothetical protein